MDGFVYSRRQVGLERAPSTSNDNHVKTRTLFKHSLDGPTSRGRGRRGHGVKNIFKSSNPHPTEQLEPFEQEFVEAREGREELR